MDSTEGAGAEGACVRTVRAPITLDFIGNTIGKLIFRRFIIDSINNLAELRGLGSDINGLWCARADVAREEGDGAREWGDFIYHVIHH